ncbi:MAG: SH3 domain-containing protein [Promethearchaeota archaeon]
MKSMRVTKPHNPESPDVLTMRTGDTLRGEKRETVFEGWLWCTDESGTSAWIPEEYLTRLSKSGTYKALRDYTSFEMSVDIGQEVVIEYAAAGWAWVRTPDDREGWVPLEILEEVDKVT